MTLTGYLQNGKQDVSLTHGVSLMLVNWLEVRSKLTHFGGLVMAWFWSEYALDDAFRSGVDSWIHGLRPLIRVLFGASMSFFMWYRNPKRKEVQ